MDREYIKIKKMYDNNVKNYAKNGGVLLLDNLNNFISFIPLGGSILDIGSGVGQDTEFFYKKGYKAVGIDFSNKMVEYSKKKRLGGKFISLDLFEIKNEFTKKSFDGIWISSVITNLKNDDIIRVLRIVNWALAFSGVVGIVVRKKIARRTKVGYDDVIFNEFYEKRYKKLS